MLYYDINVAAHVNQHTTFGRFFLGSELGDYF